jgi:hypothetical protein
MSAAGCPERPDAARGRSEGVLVGTAERGDPEGLGPMLLVGHCAIHLLTCVVRSW